MIVDRVSCARGSKCMPILGHHNWVQADDVHVRFDLRHRSTSILLTFLVEEPHVRALSTELNGPVWEDSCVEFFLSTGKGDLYYNFEFNAIGTMHAAHGPDRYNRELIPAGMAKLVEANSSLGNGAIQNLEGGVKWELDIVIPVKALWKDEISDISGMNCSANLYKCGDKLKKPHYLSWMPVNAEKPDFHRPEFFGELEFSP